MESGLVFGDNFTIVITFKKYLVDEYLLSNYLFFFQKCFNLKFRIDFFRRLNNKKFNSFLVLFDTNIKCLVMLSKYPIFQKIK